MKKPSHVYLKLSGHWFLMPHVAEACSDFIRQQAAQTLRRLRSWGRGYYSAEVVRP